MDRGQRAEKSTWDAVSYAPDLADEVLALYRRVWGDIEIAQPDFHRWQYEQNPAGPALAGLARERTSGRVIGQFGAVPLRVSIDGEERAAALALNVATEEAYRRQGVFVRLAGSADEQMARASVALAFAMPNENSFPGFVGHLGYRHVGDVPLLVRPVNLRRLVRARAPLPGLGTLAAVLGRPLVAPLSSAAPPIDGVTVTPVERFDEEFDAFWQRIRGRQRVMVVRDAAYLEWRFHEIPLRRYECNRALVEGQMAGYAVLRVAEIAGMRGGLVVDFVVDPRPAGALAGRALLAHAMARFAHEDVDLLASLMLPHAPEYRLLRRAGFWPLPRPLLPQRFRLVARDCPAANDLRHWFLTMGDYDVV